MIYKNVYVYVIIFIVLATISSWAAHHYIASDEVAKQVEEFAATKARTIYGESLSPSIVSRTTYTDPSKNQNVRVYVLRLNNEQVQKTMQVAARQENDGTYTLSIKSK